jgi:hypothetical protein
MTTFSFIAAMIITARCIAAAANLSKKSWIGHPLRFLGLDAAYSLIAGGALGYALHWEHGAMMLLTGVALWALFYRRKHGEFV